MFAVAFLLNRGYLRKLSRHRVEFAPNLYPIVAERLSREARHETGGRPANDDALAAAMQRKFHA